MSWVAVRWLGRSRKQSLLVCCSRDHRHAMPRVHPVRHVLPQVTTSGVS